METEEEKKKRIEKERFLRQITAAGRGKGKISIKEMEKERSRQSRMTYTSPERYPEPRSAVEDTAKQVIDMGKGALSTAGNIAATGVLTREIGLKDAPRVFGSVLKEELKSGGKRLLEKKASDLLSRVVGRGRVRINVGIGRR